MLSTTALPVSCQSLTLQLIDFPRKTLAAILRRLTALDDADLTNTAASERSASPLLSLDVFTISTWS